MARLAIQVVWHCLQAPLTFFLHFAEEYWKKPANIGNSQSNPDSDVTPGNEFILETLATWKVSDNLWAGPAVNFTIGTDSKRNGAVIGDSGLMKFAVGGELYYRGFSRAKLSLAAYQDIVTRNTTEGLMLLGRIVIPF